MILRCPAPEPLAALLASLGWVGLWVAVSALAGSWWWLLFGESLHLMAAGGLVWWSARLEAEIEAAVVKRRAA